MKHHYEDSTQKKHQKLKNDSYTEDKSEGFAKRLESLVH